MKKYLTKYSVHQSKTHIGLCELSKCINGKKIQKLVSVMDAERPRTGMRQVGSATQLTVQTSDSEIK